MFSDIYLIGMPGSGKSATGKLLAKAFNFSFVDTDDLIEKRSQMIIKDIFSEYGEDYFRKLETEVLDEVSKKKNQVVSTGGGIIIREENWSLMRAAEGVTVYLKTSPEWILKRTAHTDKRPLLNTGDQVAAINKLYNARQALYNRATITCVTDQKSPNAVASEIERTIRESKDS